MKCKMFFLIVAIISSIGCSSSDNQINLFFNPSLAFDLNEISVRVKIDNDVILDTLIKNDHIDESLFLKSFSYKSTKNGLLYVEINGKRKDINRVHGLSKCTDIFLKYDDHSLIFKEARKIENERADRHAPTNFKQLFDSIKASSNNKYHQVIFNMKEGNCNRR